MPVDADALIVGRENEMGALKHALDEAVSGRGSEIIVFGEPGIGKTRLIEAFRAMAEWTDIKFLCGASSQASAKPFQAFSQALSGIIADDVFEPKSTSSFSLVMVSYRDGTLIAHASPPRVDEDAESIAMVMAAIQGFVRDSFAGGGGQGLGKVELHGRTFLAEHGRSFVVSGVVRGPECPEMREALSSVLTRIEASSGDVEPSNLRGGFDTAFIGKELSRLASKSFSVRRDFSGVRLESEMLRIADETIRCLVASSRDNPLAIVLEDMHWADESSMSVLSLIASSLRREKVLVICTARQTESSHAKDALDRMVRDGTATGLHLEGLDEDGVSAIVGSRFPQNDFPDSFYETLRVDCAGNPLFVIELLRQMVTDGAIAEVEGNHRLVSPNYKIPTTVDDVVRRRIASLDTDALALAEYASCFGREFPFSAVLEMPGAMDSSAAAARLVMSGIVVENDDEGSFVHALFQSSVYAGISPRWRSSHHRSIGEWYESSFRMNPDDAAYELARHFSLTSEHAKAHRYCMMAGAKAESSYAMEQAAAFYRSAATALGKARDIPRSEARMAEAMERLGDVLLFVGDSSSAVRAFEESSGTGKPTVDAARLKRKQAEARFRLGEYESSQTLIREAEAMLAGTNGPELGRSLMLESQIRVVFGQLDEALSALEQALAIFESGKAMGVDTATVLKQIGVVHWRRGEYQAAAQRFSQSLEAFEREGDLRGASAVLNNLGLVHSNLGQPKVALDYYLRAIEAMERIGDKYSLTMAYNNMGLLYSDLGQLELALQYYKRSHALRERIGDKGGMIATLVNMGNLLMGLGRFVEARGILEEGLRISKELGDRKSAAGASNALGCVLKHFGDLEGAKRLFDEAVGICKEIDENYILAHAHDNIGLLRLDTGDAASALTEFTRSFELRRQMDDRNDMPWTHYELARAYLALGDLDEAESHAREACALAEEIGLGMDQGAGLMVSGLVLAAKGHRSEAMDLLKQAASAFTKCGHRSLHAEALYETAMVMAASGDRGRARSTMEEALSEFEAIGERSYIEKCRKALELFEVMGMRLRAERCRDVQRDLG